MKNKNHHSVKTVPKITTPSKLFQKSPLRQNCSKNHHSVRTVPKITTPSKLFQKSPLRQNCSKYHHSARTVAKITTPSELFQKSNRNIAETEAKIDNPNTYGHDHSFSWLGIVTSIKQKWRSQASFMGGSYLMTFITSGFTPTQIFYGYL